MDFKKKSAKKIVASSFVFLMLLALFATGASASDMIRDRDQLQDGSCTDSDCDQDQDRLKDGSCQESSTTSILAGICDRLQDRDQDRLNDGSCQASLLSGCAGGCDRDQDRDRLKDGSCLD